MPEQPLAATHQDHAVVAPIVRAILRSVGGLAELEVKFPLLLRTAIDEVIDAPRTGRFLLEQTEKTEKTYLGTKIEILVRSLFGFTKGKVLDLSVNGVEVDIKNTMRGESNWDIPLENVARPAILIRSSEKTALCDLGVAVLHEVYLRPGRNQDQKRGLSAAGMVNVWWLLRNHPYPINFWQLMTLAERQALVNAGGGTQRVAALFEKIQRRPISRTQIQALTQQHDYMKRIRRNSGARDLLAPKGIAILWGGSDANLIAQFGLGPVTREEFISYKPTDPDHISRLRSTNHID
jgi:hypothetical protein